MQRPTILLKHLRPAYKATGEEYWFDQWHARNLTNLAWLCDEGICGKPTTELKILDLGVGLGGASVALAGVGAFVVGLDDFNGVADARSAAVIRFLRQMNVHTVRAKLSDIPLRAGAFDVVILNDVLEHVAVPRRLLARANDLLRPHGMLILEVPNCVSLYKRIRVLCGLSNYYRIADFYHDKDYRGHVREFTKREVAYMLTLSGFQPLDCRCINQAKRPAFESEHKGKPWLRKLLYLYDIVSSAKDSWKDHVCCLARKLT